MIAFYLAIFIIKLLNQYLLIVSLFFYYILIGCIGKYQIQNWLASVTDILKFSLSSLGLLLPAFQANQLSVKASQSLSLEL